MMMEKESDFHTAYLDRLMRAGLETTDGATEDFEEALISLQKERLREAFAASGGLLGNPSPNSKPYKLQEKNTRKTLDRLVRIFWQRCETSSPLLRDENAVRQSIARKIIEDGGLKGYTDPEV